MAKANEPYTHQYCTTTRLSGTLLFETELRLQLAFAPPSDDGGAKLYSILLNSIAEDVNKNETLDYCH